MQISANISEMVQDTVTMED